MFLEVYSGDNPIYYIDCKVATACKDKNTLCYIRFLIDSKELITLLVDPDMLDDIVSFMKKKLNIIAAFYSYDSIYEMEELFAIGDSIIEDEQTFGELHLTRIYPGSWVRV